MKYKKLTGIILKKQNYREADQILTVWTREAGKMRVLAKSLRLPKSKLVYNLCELTEVSFEVVGSKNLPVVISASCIRNFKNLKSDLIKMGSAFYASELMLKLTADEHPNHEAFAVMADFLQTLNSDQSKEHYFLIDNFALKLALVLGFGNPKKVESHLDVRNFIENLIERSIQSELIMERITHNP